MSDKPETKLTLKIRMAGASKEALADLFDKLTEMGYLARSEDLTLVCGYWYEEDGRRARDAAESLFQEHPAIYRKKTTTALTTKRPTPPLDAPEEDDGEDEDEDLPMLMAIRAADEVNAGLLDRDGVTVRASVAPAVARRGVLAVLRPDAVIPGGDDDGEI